MKVSDAVLSRKSIRAFTDVPVSNKVIEELLTTSARSASGGNLQPWKIYVINGPSMKTFLDFQSTWFEPESPAYDIYPPNLKEPYRTSRYELGEQMYELLGIARDDKDARLTQVMQNFKFFGAPAAIFCFVDRQMGPPQWSDLGMFLQTFMLLAQEYGIDTCAQEAWSMKNDSVSEFVDADESDILFCGLALGYKDEDAVINKLSSERRPLDQWAKFL
ncbi:nitroreductase [Gammaproteobacteria bacterium]|nr:nitroreductase [Gammaproteobacteria bacterium]MDA9834662.1 nitroreductase [Gammaproteobacteria bacterium]